MSSLTKNRLGGTAARKQKPIGNKRRRRLDVSIIIPVYNDAVRLKKGLTILDRFLRSVSWTYEIIIVDDGSEERASPQLTALSPKRYPFHMIRLPINQGKGRAIAEGVKEAKGKHIVFLDCDMSVHPRHIHALLESLKKASIAIATRRHKESVIEVHQSGLREGLGRVFTFLSNVLCDVSVSDATCGMKAFRNTVAKSLFSKQQIHRWVFDTEILFLARRLGHAIIEVPVHWEDKQGTKVKPQDAVFSFIDLVKIRWNWSRGAYEMRSM